MGMNRRTDIKKSYFKNKQAWKAIIINCGKCSKYIFLSSCVKNNFLRAQFCVIKQNLENIVEIYENHRKELHIL